MGVWAMGAASATWDDELFDCLEIGLILTDLSNRKIIRANAAACRLLGRRRTDLIGAVWESLVEPSQLGERAQPRRFLIDEATAYKKVAHLIRPDGTVSYLQVVVLPIDFFTENHGDRPCRCRLILDITDVYRVCDLLHLALETTSVSLTLIDRSGRPVLWGEGRIPQPSRT